MNDPVPLYFAYGSNMDERALQTRCPKARLLGRARLARHRFVLMANGFASVRRDPRSHVHGVLFDLALSDVPPLDRYEGLASGLYGKVMQPVVREGGSAVQALLYVGHDGSGGTPPQAYAEAIVAAAVTVGLPQAYVECLSRAVGRGGTPRLPTRPQV